MTILVSLFSKLKVFTITEELVIKLKKKFPDFKIIAVYNKEDFVKYLPEADILFGWYMPAKYLPLAKKLKWIHTPAAGIDYIMSEELKKTNILFTTSKGIHAIAMAEHVFALILALARKINYAITDLRGWYPIELENIGFPGVFELYRKNIVVVGAGHIGKRVAEIAQAFGMNVWGITRTPRPISDPWLDIQPAEKICHYLPKMDIVVNLLPATKETYHFFNDERFNCFKDESIYISAGRGSTTDEEALYKALTNGKLLGAGIDVLEEEPPKNLSKLFNLKNCIITPHMAAWTPQYLARAVDYFIRLIPLFLKNQPLPNEVNVSKKEY